MNNIAIMPTITNSMGPGTPKKAKMSDIGYCLFLGCILLGWGILLGWRGFVVHGVVYFVFDPLYAFFELDNTAAHRSHGRWEAIAKQKQGYHRNNQ